MKIFKTTIWTAVGLFGLAALVAMPAAADFVIADDLIVDGSACIGFDCVNGESFGFDTIRIKENNLRIKAQDTSTSASFPTQDWQITFNETTNGGANKFSVDCVSPGSSTPFTVEGCAPSHSLYVDDGGRIGLGTNAPVVDLHVVSGNTPTLRLQQDGSSGFAPQTWDVAGNEANFFIRDATNGSTLPFRIKPGAPTNAISIDSGDGNVGMGTNSPSQDLHVRRTAGTTFVVSENTGAVNAGYQMVNSAATWNNLVNSGGRYVVSLNGTGVNELEVDDMGNLFIRGVCNEGTFGAGSGTCADYVFEPGYELMPLGQLAQFIAENKHLPNVPSTEEIKVQGVNLQQHQGRLLEKIEELVLYTLEQQETIDALSARLEALEPPASE